MTKPSIIPLLYCAALGACGAGSNPFDTTTEVTSPAVGGAQDVGRATQVGDGTITINQAARAVTLPATPLTTSIVTAIADGSTSGFAVQGVGELAAGGVSDSAGFAGISGPLDADGPGKNATFSGRYGVTTLNDQSSGLIELQYTFADGSLRNVGGPLSVNATSTGAQLDGTVTFAGQSGALSGGFYGQGRLLGSFNGDTMGGVIYATD